MDVSVVVVQLLSPFFAKIGSKAADAAVAGAKALYASIRKKFDADGDAYAITALDRLAEAPDDPRRQRALADVLDEKIELDKVFGDELQGRVSQLVGDRSVNEFLVQVYGGEVGKIVQIGQAGDVHF